MQLLLVLVGLLLATWFLYRMGQDLDAPVRKRVLRWLLVPALLLAVLLGLRWGAAWLPLLAAGALAVVKRLLPWLLRLAPLAWSHWKRRRGGSGARAEPGVNSSAVGKMTRAEALEVLGLSEGASQPEIQDAYRRLIQRVHPDKPGGSQYLAAKLNQARSTLSN